MGKEAKTNAMRMLERAKIAYEAHEYPHEEGVAVDGVRVAESMGQNPDCVFKTLVTQGADKNYYVFVIPVAATLDLKKAARSVGVKKQFVTRFDESCLDKPTIFVSAGRIGTQIEASPAGLMQASRGETASLTMAE